MKYNCHLDLFDLQQYVKHALGAGYVVSRVENRFGGAQKVVYKVACTNHFVCMLYVWDLSKNYFQQEIEAELINKQSYGCDLFESNQAFLSRNGIRTPQVLYLNKERDRYPFDFALVEYIDGLDAAHYLDAETAVQEKVFGRLGTMLTKMHSLERDAFGKINDSSRAGKCHTLELENAKEQLAYAVNHISALQVNHGKLIDKLNELEAAIEPRARYSFIHGELGPDHVIVNDELEPYLVDLEGSMYYDVEYEHSFLEFRFGDAYSYLDNARLDRSRMLFYKFYHHISCASGGLKLLHRGFPNRGLAEMIVEHNYRSALKFIEISEGDL
ncbi:aminoglycoside phosphotransferase family protein [Bacillus sp. FJAT-26390]|uniref:aminoglycoside phosphotransferase family protein n=1 Tax=Bacillus sp. FJAT-26390 TaxID=1743142 RepID=UPI0009E4B845|nr:aminoglycoside phosphotransferase family protein [Bacillus sp. FJAT-26390]